MNTATFMVFGNLDKLKLRFYRSFFISLWEMLLKNGIKARNCDDFIGLTEEHIRIAVKKHTDNERLLEIIIP